MEGGVKLHKMQILVVREVLSVWDGVLVDVNCKVRTILGSDFVQANEWLLSSTELIQKVDFNHHHIILFQSVISYKQSKFRQMLDKCYKNLLIFKFFSEDVK